MSDLERINEELKNLSKQQEADQLKADDIRVKQDEIRKVKAELHKMLQEQITKENALREAASLNRQRRTSAQKKIDSLERARIRAEEEEKISRKLKDRGEILDIITAGAPWREWAFDHQIDGAKQLAISERGILADKRGLGKTLTSIIWLDMLKVKKSVIFVPKEAATAFRKQMPKWAPHRPLFDLVSQRAGVRNVFLDSLKNIPEWNILINLEAWRRDSSIIDKLIELQPEAAIIDEAHSIKDPRTSMFKGVKDVIYPDDREEAWHTADVIPSIKYVLPMSGTSYLNYPDELWSLLHLVDRRAWPSKRNFVYDYLYQDGNGRYRFNPYNNAEEKLLTELGLRFVQRDRKDAGVVIPPQEIVIHELEWDTTKYAAQYQAYRDLEIKSAVLLQNMDESAVMGVEGLALFTRLRQMITWPAGIELRHPDTKELLLRCNVEQSIKLDFATDLVKQIKEESDSCVLFCQFREPLRELKRRLDREGIRAVILDGSTSPHMRERIKTDFDAMQTDDNHAEWDVVLANYKVGGQSLDFTRARQMICVDQEWNPGRNDQAYGRIDRIGQTRDTIVHVIRVVETIDDVMQEIIDRKAKGITAFEEGVRAGTQYLKKLSG